MAEETTGIAVLARIRDVAPRPVAWLCDIWGVLHNGVAAFPAAVEACVAFRATGGVVLLVSNAPRPAEAVALQLLKLGVPAAAYDGILTSGDVTRDLLARWKGHPTYHLGPERDRGIFAGLDLRLGTLTDADVIVCTGLFDDTRETAESYRETLERAARRDIPMVCANPDLYVERGGQIIACAGAVAELYAACGGQVRYAGKPHTEVYTAAVARISAVVGRSVGRGELLAIGDGVNTDIKGAAIEGIPAVYVASAVHLQAPFSTSAVAALFQPLGFWPQAAIEALRW
jgi:HAD superfamily hydrolase (TIGR01459 family)